MSRLAYVLVESWERQAAGERPGQAAFNALASFDIALAVEITGTDIDPFHNDLALRAFWYRIADELSDQ